MKFAALFGYTPTPQGSLASFRSKALYSPEKRCASRHACLQRSSLGVLSKLSTKGRNICKSFSLISAGCLDPQNCCYQYQRCRINSSVPVDTASPLLHKNEGFGVLTKFDDMCRTRVMNYVGRKRCGASKEKPFKLTRVSIASGETKWCASLDLPIDDSALTIAIGYAETEKDAELACTAHAEAILDTLCIPLFLLGSGQRKYAEMKRKEGKSAPMPGEPRKKIQEVKLPKPMLYTGLDVGSRSKLLNTKIRYVRTSKDEEREVEESENGKYMIVSIPLQSQTNAANYIMNPHIYDTNAVQRIHRLYYTLFGIALEAVINIKEVARQKENSGGLSSFLEYHASVVLPLDEKTFGRRVALGVSKISRFSMSLCAMHIELIFDAIGIPVFKREDLQQAHAEGVKRSGRWAPLPGDDIRPKEPTPLPLKRGTTNYSASNEETETEDVLNRATLKEVDVIDSSAVRSLKKIHYQQGWPYFDEKSSIVKAVNRGMFSSHRCVTSTYKLPVDEAKCGERVAIGVGTTGQSADILCCMHAMQIIKVLNVLHNYEGATKETPTPSVPCLLNDNLGSSVTTDSTEAQCDASLSVVNSAESRLPAVEIGKTTAADVEREKAQRDGYDQTAVHRKLDGTASLGPTESAMCFNPIPWHTDTVDGYKLIRLPAKMTSQYALIRATESDELSRPRIAKYLATHSSSSQRDTVRQVFASSKILMVDPDDANNYQVYYRSRGTIHIPGIGALVAMGESYTSDDAEILACMHAEMLIDHVGGQFYKKPELQNKRSALTIKSGRWAPTVHDSIRTEAKGNLPPPLRRRPAEKMLKDFSMLIAEELLEGGKDRHEILPIGAYKEHYLRALGDVLNHHKDTSAGTFDVLSVMKFSRVRISQGRRIFQASIILPLDEKYGDRTAIGLANSKVNAEKMCILHAIRILDALGIPLFPSAEEQKEHMETGYKEEKRFVAGRYKNLSNIITPLPIKEKSTTGYVCPVFPSPEKINDYAVWKDYVGAIILFLSSVQEEKDEQFLKQGKIPRTGNPLVDEALDAVESNSFATSGCQRTLQAWCEYTGNKYPSTINFRSLKANDLVHSYFPLPGFPEYIAHGLHQSKPISIKRAVAHGVYMLTYLDKDFRDRHKKAEQKHAQLQNWDEERYGLTPTGEITLFHLFEKITKCPPLDTHVKFDKENLTYELFLTLNDGSLGAVSTTVRHGTKSGALELARRRLIDILLDKHTLTQCDVRHIVSFIQRFPTIDASRVIHLQLPFHGDPQVSDMINSLAELPPSAKSFEESLATRAAKTSDKFYGVDESEASCRGRHKSREKDPMYAHFMNQRSSLPIMSLQPDIIKTLRENQVVVVCAAAGSGKTTQIPQYILDDAIEKGRPCCIAVTQPRRISAISVAKRVAHERLESVGASVGYVVRLDAKAGKHITFMTSGLLYRLIRTDRYLSSYTHIILDEVHERDVYTDLLAALLRDLLERRPELKLVVMSATMHKSLFAKYFDNAPVLHCEKGIYKVDIHHLDEIASLAADRNVKTTSTMSLGPAPELLNSAIHGQGLPRATAAIDYRLLAFLVEYILNHHDVKGASILVFLPGWGEILNASEAISHLGTRADILLLHSSVGTNAQLAAFAPPHPEKVKIVLTTNICESSITIPDVRIVIDCGRLKEKITIHSEEESTYQTTLVEMHASRANCIQRAGRAGRTQKGICYRLFTKEHFELLPHYQTPEIMRRQLDDICLSLLSFGISKPDEYLQSKLLNSPSPIAIRCAMLKLRDTGAIDSEMRLTPLGYHLDPLPLEPSIGKMVLFGIALGCLDLALTLAAAMSVSPFDSSFDARDGVKINKDIFSRKCRSDHLASVNAYNEWASHRCASKTGADRFVREHSLSGRKLEEMSLIKHQVHSVLATQNYITDVGAATSKEFFVDRSMHSTLSEEVAIGKALLACSLYPNVAIRGPRCSKTKSGDSVIDSLSVLGTLEITKSAEQYSPYYMFGNAQKQGSAPHHLAPSVMYRLNEVTNISLWSLLLFGVPLGSMEYLKDINMLVIDQWIFAVIDNESFQFIKRLKQSFLCALSEKLLSPFDAQAKTNLYRVQRCLVSIVRMAVKGDQCEDQGKITPFSTGRALE
ncbi:RNA editing associated helicase 2 [Perkinsela sp. CCAP 1560/4]|nr:RNA editing associated helicase 2 [Perkinsela sp. CCAP 1560/4]|eukprot:KNH04737.1 RNA editing associated helicase 2 [Perkinsela sp. CCAP 1560/4]